MESKPQRTYRRRRPGARQADTVQPGYHGVGLLQVATNSHNGIRTRGLGLMFPAHTVHARNSAAVVVGNNCELTQVDHVHIRQAVVADDDALRSAEVTRVLASVHSGRDKSQVVRDLRATLTRLVERPLEGGPSQAERRLHADCTAEIYGCASVRVGDGTTTRADSRYVVERTVIPAGASLADNEDLARHYVDIVTGANNDPSVVAGFLSDLVGAAGNTGDENVLGYADGLPREPATLLGLFGMASVNRMTSIMIGGGNELHAELELTTQWMRIDDSLSQRLAESLPPASPDPASPCPPAASSEDRLEQGR